MRPRNAMNFKQYKQSKKSKNLVSSTVEASCNSLVQIRLHNISLLNFISLCPISYFSKIPLPWSTLKRDSIILKMAFIR